ncbi:MAG: hypothetical protein RSD01_08575 [Ruthenibacterium sp.]
MNSAPRQGSAALAAYHQRKAKTRKIMLFAAFIVVIMGGVVWLIWHSGLSADANAAPTVSGRLSEQEIANQLQAQVDAGMFSCEINPTPHFANADSTGLLAIRNGPSNAQDMRVSITLDDTGETVYTGKVLHPGEQIVEDKLSCALAAGTYPATASVAVLKADSEDAVANVQMALTITVQA